MYHSINFGEKNTWDDWHLIPSSRPVFSPPQPNIRLLNIPGKSGSLDVTDGMGGQVVYADRTGSFEFYVDHEYWKSWAEAYQTITNYLHGQRMQAWLEDDPSYYYEGRFAVNEWHSNAQFSSIVISYTVGPYKMLMTEVGSDWMWDTFFFGTPKNVSNYTAKSETHVDGDVLRTMSGLLASEDGTAVTLTGYGYRSIPVIHVYAKRLRLSFDGGEPIELLEGDNQPSGVIITEGDHRLVFYGNGLFDIHYRGGSL